jgi:hypothetical protein
MAFDAMLAQKRADFGFEKDFLRLGFVTPKVGAA